MHTEGSLHLHGACGPLREFKKVCIIGHGYPPVAERASGGAWTEAGYLLPREPLEVCELAGQPVLKELLVLYKFGGVGTPGVIRVEQVVFTRLMQIQIWTCV